MKRNCLIKRLVNCNVQFLLVFVVERTHNIFINLDLFIIIIFIIYLLSLGLKYKIGEKRKRNAFL